jgi:Methyltransferase domain
MMATMSILTTRLDLLDLMPKRAVCAEAGVQKGDFAAQILARCEPQKLYLIDLWRHQEDCLYEGDKSNVADEEHEAHLRIVTDRFRSEISSGQIEIIRNYVHTALYNLGMGRLDWIYLDADHTRVAVERDLLAAEHAVKDSGIIAGHDYGMWPDLAIEVMEPVNLFCAGHGWTMMARTLNDTSCDGFDSYALVRRRQ